VERARQSYAMIPRKLIKHADREIRLPQKIFILSCDSAVNLETSYRLNERGVKCQEFSPRHPDRLWDPPRLLPNAYKGTSPGGKAAETLS
jgi:hypothetical protein